ncbi:MAG: hypothetical protein DBX55_06145 [Verrucomicrobia bacterium]|nr:MAG: hypothetical protein DBX55_06145 [Verrucomicrobiota bacterium]
MRSAAEVGNAARTSVKSKRRRAIFSKMVLRAEPGSAGGRQTLPFKWRTAEIEWTPRYLFFEKSAVLPHCQNVSA